MLVKLENKSVEVKKLPLGKYAELLKVLRTMPDKISGVFENSTGKNADLLAQIPGLIEDNLPEAIKIIHIGSGVPENEVAEMGLDECISLIEAIIEVNKYAEIYEKLKKASARFRNPVTDPTAKKIG